ncbi:hypothetical protein V6N12_011468 [Hibiscus sabdariffa]|uniref:Uncharacterized protein n=1 Tax=Hibiscus sabdariffa TaxID=183260 RepID=A0ABR2BMW2_9ROSI
MVSWVHPRSLCAASWLLHKPTIVDGAWGRVGLRPVASDDQISLIDCPQAGEHDGGLRFSIRTLELPQLT